MKLFALLLLSCNVNAKDIKHARPNWEGVKTDKCKETMREWILRRDALELETSKCKIIGGVYKWAYYNKKQKYEIKKNIQIDHILPRKWFFDNCFNSVFSDVFIKAYNQEFNLIATYQEENIDKSDWVCNKKGYKKFLSKITEEKHKELCDKQYEICLLFNKNYNNACGNKCKDLIYGR